MFFFYDWLSERERATERVVEKSKKKEGKTLWVFSILKIYSEIKATQRCACPSLVLLHMKAFCMRAPSWLSILTCSNRKCGIEKPMKKQFSSGICILFACQVKNKKKERFSLGLSFFNHMLLRLSTEKEWTKLSRVE